ncbi:uncharacterized protein F5891DRAFT_1254799 [Suillus fuscotomentosus]|uniref:DUF6830 domain-containing protein n=1 Tax=Suillus fuscotomentosus TaxID=1912939 RepID=A0AAD4HFJ7_9AGAM|nr:uncharacterized protein F5891DRAFT_1254799 [Suillus fuscotomentosus]KAG1894657.1 hypothetical protein F5891DRAFT_1254799 [Suillus fuscotomentosus]
MGRVAGLRWGRVDKNDLSGLSRVSGTEHNQICRFLLGIIDIRLPGNLDSGRLIRAVRAILDFLYLAQYPCHTNQTLALLTEALTRFHDNKSIFVDLGIRANFNLPKLHFFRHYVHMIKLYGTTDNYNTEYTERLHIDLAKDAYRATNHKDEYTQMTLWLERREKMLWHNNFVQWRLAGDPPPQDRLPPDMDYRRSIKMTKHPTIRHVPLDSVVRDYGATFFTEALACYVVRTNQPGLSPAQLEQEASHVILPFQTVAAFHRVKFHAINAHGHRDSTVTMDSVHCQPPRKDKRRQIVPARFDTVLVNKDGGGTTGVDGYRVAQVRIIFMLTSQATAALFRTPGILPTHFAYVEWFTPFGQPEANHGLYKISRLIRNGERLASIIDISDIRRSVHLIPKFGPVAPREWTSSTVLELCSTFFVNSFSDRHAYLTII